MEEEPTARRFALKYDPPTVILEYRTSEGLFHYRMRIKNLTSQMDPDDVTKALFEHHPRYLDVNKVKFSQVRRLVEQLMRKLAPDAKHATGATSPPTQQTETTTPARLDPRLQFTEDLNKVSEVRERETHGANARTTPRVLRGTRCAMGARARDRSSSWRPRRAGWRPSSRRTAWARTTQATCGTSAPTSGPPMRIRAGTTRLYGLELPEQRCTCCRAFWTSPAVSALPRGRGGELITLLDWSRCSFRMNSARRRCATGETLLCVGWSD